mmetsp:Transcript_19769/g.35235  ORF Transcript_19769/g.35235 Transcript_19769/m.35235 type:complete len:287 (-) Transcript_19769:335-1195(-)
MRAGLDGDSGCGQNDDELTRRFHTVHVSGLHPDVLVEDIKRFFESSCGGVVKTRLATMGSRVLCWLEFANGIATQAALDKNDKPVPLLSPHRLKVVRSRNAIQAKVDGTMSTVPSQPSSQSISAEPQYPVRKPVELFGASVFEPDVTYAEAGCRTTSSYDDRAEHRRHGRAEGSTSPRHHARISPSRRSSANRSVSPPLVRKDFAHESRPPAAYRKTREVSPPAEQHRDPWNGSLPRYTMDRKRLRSASPPAATKSRYTPCQSAASRRSSTPPVESFAGRLPFSKP